jgi:hypothetical protein
VLEETLVVAGTEDDAVVEDEVEEVEEDPNRYALMAIP